MIQKLKPVALSLCLLGIVSTPVFAAQTDTNSVEQQLNHMQKEIQSLRMQVNAKHKSSQAASAKVKTIGAKPKQAGSDEVVARDPLVGPQNLPTDGSHFIGVDIDAPGQSFVSTGPYIGIPISYSGGNLIINTPSINEDVSLLNLRKNIHDRMRALHIPITEDHEHLLLSGVIESQAMYRHPGSGPSSSELDLTSAGLDAYILGPSHWTSGLISFAYDNDIGANSGSFNNISRTQNSRVFINKAFVVLGDFEVSPLYATLGQMYVPFGTYSSNMISSPMTKVIGRIKDRAILVGYQGQGDDALYFSGYAFRGDTHVGSVSRISNGGFNAGYRFVQGNYSGNFGGGVVANIADSQGMQNTGGSPLFGGFGGVNGSGNEQLAHRVPALDLRGLFSIGSSIDLLAEYIGALNSFNVADMTYQSNGAKPQALNAEAAYTFSVYSRPTTLAVGYGKTYQALAVGVPLARMSVTLNTSIWKDTLQSLELRHDINYAASSTATGSGINAIPATGKSDNMVTAQFDMYF